MNHVFEITTNQFKQVTLGKQYTIDCLCEYGMVKLVGISHPVPMTAGKLVPATQSEANSFAITRYRLVEEVMVMTNVPGENKQHLIGPVKTTIVEEYHKDMIEVGNTSEYILTLP